MGWPADLALRFVAGGALVSLFSIGGQALRPRTFAGLFGAAPSVALASLGLTLATRGKGPAILEARSMLLGAIALAIYCGVCVWLAKRSHPNLWLDTALAWVAWLIPALGLWWLTIGRYA